MTTSYNEWYNEWQRMTTRGTTCDNEWYNERQWMATNDSEWQLLVILPNFPFFRIREEPTTMHPKETP